ncbi:MAG: helix-turn-helix domain-containing protein [Brevundimonas sp.]|nr:helix-turn-helix domain-containing protein [Brevundimonas sp.]
MSGVNVETIRTWRKRKALKSNGGVRTRFSVNDVAALIIRRELMAAGISTADSQRHAEAFSATVVFVAVYEGGSCDWRGTPAQARELKEACDTLAFMSEVSGFDGSQPELILISFNGEDFESVRFFRTDTDLSGVRRATFLNLEELGGHLARSAPRPILVIGPGD